MKKLEPNYNCPYGQTILRRLRITEDEVRTKIENQLAKVCFVALDTDCWTSISQEGYINVNAHIIDDQWKQQIMTICIEELEERHTAENLADCLQNVAAQFGIQEKMLLIKSTRQHKMHLKKMFPAFLQKQVKLFQIFDTLYWLQKFGNKAGAIKLAEIKSDTK